VLRNVVDVGGIATSVGGRAVAAAVPTALDARRWAEHALCPALFVVSEGDRLARPGVQNRVIEAYGGQAVKLDVSGRHDDATLAAVDLPRYAEAVRRLASSNPVTTGAAGRS
jgi:hypothetical protein